MFDLPHILCVLSEGFLWIERPRRAGSGPCYEKEADQPSDSQRPDEFAVHKPHHRRALKDKTGLHRAKEMIPAPQMKIEHLFGPEGEFRFRSIWRHDHSGTPFIIHTLRVSAIIVPKGCIFCKGSPATNGLIK